MSKPVSKKSAFVAIVGRPSAGKSTLMNTLCGEKIAIASPIPQTTRNRIRGIITTGEGQLVFVDTPGFHASRRSLNRHMRGLIDEAIRDSEVLLYVVDASREPGAEERELMEAVRSATIPRIVALNKIDVTPRKKRDAILETLAAELPDVPVIEISALREDHTDALLAALFERAPEGELHYASDFYTDQDPEFRISEIIREKALSGLREELPHSLYVEVADMEVEEMDGSGSPAPWDGDPQPDSLDPNDNAGPQPANLPPDGDPLSADPAAAAHGDPQTANLPAGAPDGFFHDDSGNPAPDAPDSGKRDGKPTQRLWIRAFIYVERTSQQGMIVGKGGTGIKRIRQTAQKEIARLFPYRIHLDLRVKVDPNWSKNERVLGRIVQ